MKKTTTAKNLIIDRENFPKRTLRALPLARIDSVQFTQYSEKADRQYVLENGMRVIHLPEVRVTGQRKPLKKSFYYDNPNYTIPGDFISKFPAPNILWYLTTIPGVVVDFNNKRFYFTVTLSTGAPALIVDDMVWDMEDIEAINPSDIAQIDILSSMKAMAYGSRAFGGAVVIYYKTIEDYKDDDKNRKDIQNISPLGYQKPAEFYAPKYDTPEKRNAQTPDLRTTIFWQPVVQTNNSGEASFEFYTADDPTSYAVIIEGLAEDGSIIRQEGKLGIKGEQK